MSGRLQTEVQQPPLAAPRKCGAAPHRSAWRA